GVAIESSHTVCVLAYASTFSRSLTCCPGLVCRCARLMCFHAFPIVPAARPVVHAPPSPAPAC
ncbi:MAG: hypothetical protein JWP22_1924, partial [Ramlibacter sp.]|nr:hypothetical protein [Ramlibacter sp.]